MLVFASSRHLMFYCVINYQLYKYYNNSTLWLNLQFYFNQRPVKQSINLSVYEQAHLHQIGISGEINLCQVLTLFQEPITRTIGVRLTLKLEEWVQSKCQDHLECFRQLRLDQRHGATTGSLQILPANGSAYGKSIHL